MSVEAPKNPGSLSNYEGSNHDYQNELETFRQRQAEYLQISLEELHEMGYEEIERRIEEHHGQEQAA